MCVVLVKFTVRQRLNRKERIDFEISATDNKPGNFQSISDLFSTLAGKYLSFVSMIVKQPSRVETYLPRTWNFRIGLRSAQKLQFVEERRAGHTNGSNRQFILAASRFSRVNKILGRLIHVYYHIFLTISNTSENSIKYTSTKLMKTTSLFKEQPVFKFKSQLIFLT